MGIEDRVDIERAIERLGDKERVHTFRDAGVALIGADADREEIIARMRQWGVEEAGEGAAAMGHTLVLIDDVGSLFIEAATA